MLQSLFRERIISINDAGRKDSVVSSENILQDVAYLTEKIGIRLSGSDQERKAAAYLRRRLREYVPQCEIECFPTVCSDVAVTVSLRVGASWETLPALRFNLTPVEPVLEAPLVFWDTHTDYQRPSLACLRGKAVLHFGLFQSEADYRRLAEAKPAFVMVVDTRYPLEAPVANSHLPAWVKRYGAMPAVGVSYMTAWRLMTRGADRARLEMTGSTYTGTSWNVIGTLPGTDPEAGTVYLGGHMDSVVGSVGADDNAVGCAIVVELARVLSQRKHKRTLKFICFGTEEQLSVGSASYLRQHRQEVEREGVFMCNFDSCASTLGWNCFTVNANEALAGRIRETLNEKDVYYLADRNPDPCNDLFPFSLAGVPGITFLRKNTESGKFYHHQANNTLAVISGPVAAKLATAGRALVEQMADGDIGTFDVDPNTRRQVQHLWDEQYGGW